eukprot:3455221-Prorocentrum_lima.AAC.1
MAQVVAHGPPKLLHAAPVRIAEHACRNAPGRRPSWLPILLKSLRATQHPEEDQVSPKHRSES